MSFRTPRILRRRPMLLSVLFVSIGLTTPPRSLRAAPAGPEPGGQSGFLGQEEGPGLPSGPLPGPSGPELREAPLPALREVPSPALRVVAGPPALSGDLDPDGFVFSSEWPKRIPLGSGGGGESWRGSPRPAVSQGFHRGLLHWSFLRGLDDHSQASPSLGEVEADLSRRRAGGERLVSTLYRAMCEWSAARDGLAAAEGRDTEARQAVWRRWVEELDVEIVALRALGARLAPSRSAALPMHEAAGRIYGASPAGSVEEGTALRWVEELETDLRAYGFGPESPRP